MSSGLRPAVVPVPEVGAGALAQSFAVSHLTWDRGAVTLTLSRVGMPPHLCLALLLKHSPRGVHCQLTLAAATTEDIALLVHKLSRYSAARPSSGLAVSGFQQQPAGVTLYHLARLKDTIGKVFGNKQDLTLCWP